MFLVNAFFPVPVETWFAVAGILVFVSGLLFGIFAFCRSLAVLANSASRRASGVVVPALTVAIALAAWYMVASTAIQMKRSLDKRAQLEDEHWDEHHGTGNQTSPQSPEENRNQDR